MQKIIKKNARNRISKQNISSLGIWDYNVNTLDMSKTAVIKWHLSRKIEYNDWKSIDYRLLKKYFHSIDIDAYKKAFLKQFIDWYEHSYAAAKKPA